jgi:hypothetical protein
MPTKKPKAKPVEADIVEPEVVEPVEPEPVEPEPVEPEPVEPEPVEPEPVEPEPVEEPSEPEWEGDLFSGPTSHVELESKPESKPNTDLGTEIISSKTIFPRETGLG